MLNAHPEVAVPFEAHFLGTMALERKKYESHGAFLADRFVDGLVADWSFQRWGLPPDELRARLSAEEVQSYADAVRVLFRTYAERRGKVRYADKTLQNVMYVPMLAELFPEARFVHLIRDGRDVALALKDTTWGPDTPAQAALYWGAAVLTARRGGSWIGPDRYVEIRYEELIDDSEQVLRDLCPFLELEFDDRMVQYFRDCDEVVNSDPEPEEQRHLYLPPTKGLRDWRRDMNPADLKVFEAVAGDVLDQLGYR